MLVTKVSNLLLVYAALISFPVLPDTIWLKPNKWNQGGYDAIYIDKANHLVRFVQVTAAHKHSFLIQYFRAWLIALVNSAESFEVEKVEIYFVVEKNQLGQFKIDRIDGVGLLREWGWRMNKEVDMVQIVGIEGPKSK